MELITAAITTFNRDRYLRPAIRSVLNQIGSNFELLVLDNASTDDTPAVVQAFSDSRLRYIRHHDMTIGAQRNLAVSEARGEYIAFLDDDDEWLPRKLEKQLWAFRRGSSELGLVYGGFVKIDATGRELETHYPALRGRVLRHLLWARDPFTGSASNPMLRLDIVRDIGGFREELSTSEDWELYLRLAERYEIGAIADVVVRVRQHAGPRLGDRLSEALKVELMVLKRYGLMMDAEQRSFYLQKTGGKLCRLGELREGRRYLREAIRSNPSNHLAYAQYLISMLGQRSYERAHRLFRRMIRA